MSTLKKTLAIGTTSALALTGMIGGVAVSTQTAIAGEPDQDPSYGTQDQNEAYYDTDIVTLDVVPGTFAFTQQEVSDNSVISAISGAAKYLCNVQGHLAKDDSTLPEDWSISISGQVRNPQVVTFSEMKDSPSVQKLVMGCTCMGNPVDGRATANAEVTGFPVSIILGQADIVEGANTVVFTSADGYEVALPLSYVTERYCPLVFDVNGSPIAEVVGGSNQLWLGATSASYFARDIVSITVEERQTPPPNPSSDEARAAYQNLPNVGVLLGGEVR